MDRTMELGRENILKLLMKFSVPAIVAMLTNALYSVIDRIFVGNSVGPLGIAGITIGFPILMIMMSFMMLVGIGGNALVSIRLGESKKDEAEVILGNSFTLLIIISVIVTTLGIIFLEPLLKAFGSSNEVLPYATDFLRIILFGCVFQAIGFGMNNFIRGEGNPKMAMFTMLLGTILNLIFCPLFIYVFGMGIKGSALATVLSQAIASALVVYYFLYGKSSLKLSLKNLKLKKQIVIAIFSIGFAPFVLQFAQSIVSAIMNKSLGFYGGDTAIAAMGIVISVLMLVLMPIFGINQGVQPIIGYNFGAKKFDRVIEGFKIAAIVATIVVTIGFIFIQIFPHEIISLFSKNDTSLVEFGAVALRNFCLFLPVVGFQIVASVYFQSVGKSSRAAVLSLSRQVLFLIPLMLILPRFFNIQGIIFAGPISDLVSTILAVFLIIKDFRILKEQSVNAP
jgi:putative MATE family efflux protein